MSATEQPAPLPVSTGNSDRGAPAVPVLAYATPAGKGVPKWVRETWAFFKFSAVAILIGAFVFMIAIDEGHVSEYRSTRPLLALFLVLVAVGVIAKCLLARSVAPGWRISAALAVPFFFWQVARVYVELAYLRDGWPWMNVYAEARGAIARSVVGMAWVAFSFAGFARSRRLNRQAKAALKVTTPPPAAPG